MYDPALSRDIDRLRFDLDDTAGPPVGMTDGAEKDALLLAEMLPDETYSGQLAHNGNDLDRALYALAKHLMLHYANEPQRMSVAGKQESDWGARFSAWREIVNRAGARAEAVETQYSSGMRVVRVRRPSDEGGSEYSPPRRTW